MVAMEALLDVQRPTVEKSMQTDLPDEFHTIKENSPNIHLKNKVRLWAQGNSMTPAAAPT